MNPVVGIAKSGGKDVGDHKVFKPV